MQNFQKTWQGLKKSEMRKIGNLNLNFRRNGLALSKL